MSQKIVEPKDGQTIDLITAQRATLPEQKVQNDTGINVLIDFSHQAWFQMMWEMPGTLREAGLRIVGSHAAIDSALDPNGKSRIRIPVGNRMPFAWWKNPSYNVILSVQHDPKAQPYLPVEIERLKSFAESGGGVILSGGPVTDPKILAEYPLNHAIEAFGASITTESIEHNGRKVAVIKLGDGWLADESAGDKPIVAIKQVGKGFVAVSGDPSLTGWDDKAKDGDPRSRTAVRDRLKALVVKVSKGLKPVGGTLRIPQEDADGVGGPIYPEMEERVAGAVVYYAKNQFDSVLKTAREDVKKVDEQVRKWTPSPKPKDPMFLILAGGYGGGWAVNKYEPKEVGIIAPDADGILSILAHEVAHTCYSGPPNSKGKTAGELPGVFSEAHAGWFQRRGDAWRTGGKTGHQPNNLFTFDPDATKLDLSKGDTYPYGQAWTKLWWLWQKLDERFGTTWYPRWLWVKNTRWAKEPNKHLNWDEIVEDMSIACGEDLFPFMRKIGTTLTKDRCPAIEFEGKRIKLAVAELPMGPCGAAITGPIGDYKKPLKR